MRARVRRGAAVATLAAGVLAAAACGGGGGDAGAAATAATGYFSASGPEICAYLSRAQLASYVGAVAGETPLAACRAAYRVTAEEGSADVVEHADPPLVSYVVLANGRALVHALRDATRSVELELVREGDAWVVDVDDEALRDDPSLVGKRFAPTEEALFNALLFGPNEGDAKALADTEQLTRSYVELVLADERLGGDVLLRKLRWAISLTAGGSCDTCAAILTAGVGDLR